MKDLLPWIPVLALLLTGAMWIQHLSDRVTALEHANNYFHGDTSHLGQ